MKTSLYPELDHLFAALQQMKHAYLSSNKWYLDITWLMFEFQKTGFIDKKKIFYSVHDNTNLIQHNEYNVHSNAF